jgi:hypothetical protein
MMEATSHAGALDLQDNEPNGYRISALHLASALGLRSTVAKLLSLGANPVLQDKHGYTPLGRTQSEDVKVAFVEHCEQVCVCLLLQDLL